MTYSEKLKDPRWQRKRLEIMNRDDFKCRMCGDEKTTLHVHHLKYEGEPWEAPNDCLETLCEHCHWAKEYLLKLNIDAGKGLMTRKELFEGGQYTLCILGTQNTIILTNQIHDGKLSFIDNDVMMEFSKVISEKNG